MFLCVLVDIDQVLETLSLLNGIKVLALQVLNQRHLKHLGIARLTHHHRHIGKARDIRRAPAPFPGDQLEMIADRARD